MIINLFNRNNDLLKDGKLDEQIISDLEEYIEDRKRNQTERLDKIVRDKHNSHHYKEWTEENQLQIKYTERILECVKAHIK